MRSRLRLKNRNWQNSFLIIFLAGLIVSGCKDSATGDNGSGEEPKPQKSKTYDLVLISDGSSVGKITTSRITEEDDAYIDEGFFITLDITSSDFNAPFDLGINSGGYCGTRDVQPGDKAEMPCDYDEFLSNPEQLKITSEDGDGNEAHPSP